MRRIMALMALICLVSACQPASGRSVPPDVSSTTAAGTAAGSEAFTVLTFKGDCQALEDAFLEDETVETLPCVTKDQETKQYILVTDWDRYEHITLNKCANEDGSPLEDLPCVHVDLNAPYKYVVFVRK